MGLFTGKNALIFGVANKDSIAWGITQALHAEGATIGLSYANEKLKRRVEPLAESIGVTFLEECNVLDDAALDRVFARFGEQFGRLDVLVHAVAFAERADLEGEFVNTSREGWNLALGISAYSLVAMARRARPLMTEGGAIVALSYYGGEKVVPHYNVMGVAKAALESSVRYLAFDLGGQNIRVNALSPGPIKTLSGAGIPGFREMLRYSELASPLHKLVTPEDVGKATVWLCSDWGKLVTGQTIYIDAGYSAMGVPYGVLEAVRERSQEE